MAKNRKSSRPYASISIQDKQILGAYESGADFVRLAIVPGMNKTSYYFPPIFHMGKEHIWIKRFFTKFAKHEIYI